MEDHQGHQVVAGRPGVQGVQGVQGEEEGRHPEGEEGVVVHPLVAEGEEEVHRQVVGAQEAHQGVVVVLGGRR